MRHDPLEHPAYGCNRLEAMLALEGRRRSAITIQKILNDNGLSTRVERWLAVEQANAVKSIEITATQAALLAKLNACLRKRHAVSPLRRGKSRRRAVPKNLTRTL